MENPTGERVQKENGIRTTASPRGHRTTAPLADCTCTAVSLRWTSVRATACLASNVHCAWSAVDRLHISSWRRTPFWTSSQSQPWSSFIVKATCEDLARSHFQHWQVEASSSRKQSWTQSTLKVSFVSSHQGVAAHRATLRCCEDQ